MQKIMFNDLYGLTYAVIERYKTNTRRIEGKDQFQEMAACADQIFYNEDTGLIDFMYEGIDIFNHKPRYKVGEIVAVAQSYEQVDPQIVHFRTDDLGDMIGDHPGQSNKMFVKAELMPHQIRITGIRIERLQDISDRECIREGIRQFTPSFPKDFPIHPTHFVVGDILKDTPRDAFAVLIDKVSGRGTWDRNPWVVVYEFELLK